VSELTACASAVELRILSKVEGILGRLFNRSPQTWVQRIDRGPEIVPITDREVERLAPSPLEEVSTCP
jgi:hypothetical protein